MDPVTVSITVGRPRDEVFEYLVDVANHAEFADHYLAEWRLTREDSYGEGAGARFKVQAPLNRFSWADFTVAEAQAPYRIVLLGRGGKANRVRHRTEYTLTPGAGGTTQVELSIETEPATRADRLMESLGVRGWLRRNAARSLRRLRSILEEDRDRGARVTVAAR